ncbi:RdgB/HAM1 family non-canonical purine NTP pyrophosphatase [Actinophytocola sp. NPDC049390]|uniref:RdgB/HAM1 family non-canonical purine NTP pyrophosphatase n=1 Tax=Actinophytocola sp. NPDC049390 TaxID=3363894 RepID=UPI0037BA4FAF
MSSQLLVASRNAKKLHEMRRIIERAGIEGVTVVGLDEVPPFEETPETGATFEDNAVVKARDAVAATGLPSVADDSGIAVDALNGMPGVLSARWAGSARSDQANLELVLEQLADVPDERLGAQFVCAAALVLTDGTEIVVRGVWPGTLVRKARGTNGFGYDPIFVPEGETRTSAELLTEEKDAISHRGRALSLLLPHLRSLGDR